MTRLRRTGIPARLIPAGAAVLLFATTAIAAPTTQPIDSRFTVGELLFADDFAHGTEQWTSELEGGGTVAARDGALDVDVPAGATVWFKPELSGPILIEYDAVVLDRGGPNDRVSDLNCFWMATDARDTADGFAVKRSGAFADYNALKCYYVGLGGNSNTTTRFRRYVGDATTRPLLPEHDLRSPDVLLTPNVRQAIRLVAAGNVVQFYRDGRKLFDVADAAPYTSGRFAFRTTSSHIRLSHFRVYRLAIAPTTRP